MPDASAILVIGAGGIVGRLICQRVVQRFGAQALIISHHDAARLDAVGAELGVEGTPQNSRVVDVHDPSSIARGIAGVHLVIVATAQRQPLVQIECLRAGIPSVDVGVNEELMAQARALPASGDAIQLMAAGLFPGLSGVMARHVHELANDRGRGESSAPIHPVDVALLQSSRGTHGAAGAIDMMRILSHPVQLLPDPALPGSAATRLVRGFWVRRRLRFPLPLGERTVRLAAFVEGDLLAGQGIPANYWTGFDSRALTALIAAASRVGLLRRFRSDRFSAAVAPALVTQPDPRRSEQIGLAASSQGHEVSYLLTSDYQATAACVVAMASALLKPPVVQMQPAGNQDGRAVRFPFEIFGLDDLLPDLRDAVIVAERSS